MPSSGLLFRWSVNLCRNFKNRYQNARSVSRKTKSPKKTLKILHVAKTQCNVYISQRIRRLQKIYLLYQQAYHEYARLFLFYPIIRSLGSSRQLVFALGACGFRWGEQGIAEEEMKYRAEELIMVQNAISEGSKLHEEMLPGAWENVLDEVDVKMWKFPSREADGLVEYKVYGSFTDISAKLFFNIQMDTEYRKKWDDLVVKIEVLDEDQSREEHVVQWVTRFPYPFAPREYLCTRRTMTDEETKISVISSRAVDHPKCQPCKQYVRVTSYVSHMVIRPHKSFDDLGFDYLLTYCDDPQIVLPNRLASWVISSEVPNYVKKLHNACLTFRRGRIEPLSDGLPTVFQLHKS